MKDSHVRRPSITRALGWALLAGIAWGALARLFMRLVSTSPGFSWAGTLGIIGMGMVAFGLTGWSAGAMARGWSGWWRLLAVPALLVFAGQGLGLLPAALGTFLAVRVRNVWVRSVALVAGLVGNYALLHSVVDDDWLQPRTLMLGNALAVVAGAWLGVQFALAARPRARTEPRPVPGGRVGGAAQPAREVTA